MLCRNRDNHQPEGVRLSNVCRCQAQAFGHIPGQLTITDQGINAKTECGLLTGVLLADEDKDPLARQVGEKSQVTNNLSGVGIGQIDTGHIFILQQTLPGHIHRPGRVDLHHLGEL